MCMHACYIDRDNPGLGLSLITAAAAARRPMAPPLPIDSVRPMEPPLPIDSVRRGGDMPPTIAADGRTEQDLGNVTRHRYVYVVRACA